MLKIFITAVLYLHGILVAKGQEYSVHFGFINMRTQCIAIDENYSLHVRIFWCIKGLHVSDFILFFHAIIINYESTFTYWHCNDLDTSSLGKNILISCIINWMLAGDWHICECNSIALALLKNTSNGYLCRKLSLISIHLFNWSSAASAYNKINRCKN